jgi:nickel transport protein
MSMRAALCTILLLAAMPAAAHGVETRIIGDGAATVEFKFADGTPLAFAEAVVTAPDGTGEPAATGRTDRSGRFSFFPDRAGAWRVEVHDEGGHVARAVVTSTGQHIEVPRHAFPDWLVALSLVANVGAAGWLGRRRSGAAKPIAVGAGE